MIALTGWFVVVVPLHADILDNDLTLVYIGARIGLEEGWSHIYSLQLQHDLFAQLRPYAAFNDGERFVSPPPFAWLVIPLSVFGPAAATYAWLVMSIAALIGAWWAAAPGVWPRRGLWLLGALAWYPLLYGLSLAQPDLVILFLAALAWKLAESNRPYAAGLVLGLSVIKPQLLLLLPVALVMSGRWKIAAGWAATAALLGIVSLALIGGQGLTDYRSLLDEAQRVTNNRYFTLAYVLGPGPLSYLAQGIVVAATVAGAYLNRHASHGRIFALGIVATALGTTYWHLQDFTILVLAAWLFWREGTAASPVTPAQAAPTHSQTPDSPDNPGVLGLSTPLRLLLLLVAIGGEFAWPLTPLPILVGTAVWFAALLTGPRKAATAAA